MKKGRQDRIAETLTYSQHVGYIYFAFPFTINIWSITIQLTVKLMNLYLKLLENYISSILINATAVTVTAISLMKNNTIYNGWKSYQKKPYKIKT